MSSVAFVDFSLRRLIRREADAIRPAASPALSIAARAQLAYRETLKRCDALGIPRASSQGNAETCELSVLRGFEPSAAVKRAVDRAYLSAFPDRDPPPFAA